MSLEQAPLALMLGVEDESKMQEKLQLWIASCFQLGAKYSVGYFRTGPTQALIVL